jgi:hypothetical protein
LAFMCAYLRWAEMLRVVRQARGGVSPGWSP